MLIFYLYLVFIKRSGFCMISSKRFCTILTHSMQIKIIQNYVIYYLLNIIYLSNLSSG